MAVTINGSTGIEYDDNVKQLFGTGDDFQIYHDGSGTNLDCTNSNPLYIQSDLTHLMREDGNEWYMKCTKDAAVDLYYDNSCKFKTASYGTLQNNGNYRLMDSDSSDPGWARIQWGQSQDLQIYHEGTNSIIETNSSATKPLHIKGDPIWFYKTGTSELFCKMIADSGVELYHDGTKRFETTSVGTTITGGGDRALKVNSTHSSGGEIAYFDNGVNNHYGGLLISAGENDREVRLEAAYNSSHMSFYTSPDAGAGVEAMRISKTGQIRIAMEDFASSPSTSNYGIELFNTNGGSIWIATGETTASHMIFANGNGTCGTIQTSGTSTSFNTSSDYRLKENIVGITDGITRLKQLAPKRFNFKTNTSKVLDGFLAHEVTPIVPEAISGEKDAVITQAMVDNKEYEEDRLGEILPQGIDQAKLVPLLTAALQEAITEIETLKTKVAALEAA